MCTCVFVCVRVCRYACVGRGGGAGGWILNDKMCVQGFSRICGKIDRKMSSGLSKLVLSNYVHNMGYCKDFAEVRYAPVSMCVCAVCVRA